MDDKVAPKENPVLRRQRILRKWRLRKILRTIPSDTTGRNVLIYFRYASVAAGLSARQLARVVYPWQPRPTDPRVDPVVRVLRGRPR
jgi:hypothetical protein